MINLKIGLGEVIWGEGEKEDMGFNKILEYKFFDVNYGRYLKLVNRF